MADKMKDAEDLKLESLFASETVPDNGFSERVEKRIRRRLWVQRLSLPIAIVIGGAIAVKPLAGLLTALFRLLEVVPANMGLDVASVATIDLPRVTTMVLGGVLLLAIVGISQFLER